MITHDEFSNICYHFVAVTAANDQVQNGVALTRGISPRMCGNDNHRYGTGALKWNVRLPVKRHRLSPLRTAPCRRLPMMKHCAYRKAQGALEKRSAICKESE